MAFRHVTEDPVAFCVIPVAVVEFTTCGLEPGLTYLGSSYSCKGRRFGQGGATPILVSVMKRGWIIVLVVVIAMIRAFGFSKMQTPVLPGEHSNQYQPRHVGLGIGTDRQDTASVTTQ